MSILSGVNHSHSIDDVHAYTLITDLFTRPGKIRKEWRSNKDLVSDISCDYRTLKQADKLIIAALRTTLAVAFALSSLALIALNAPLGLKIAVQVLCIFASPVSAFLSYSFRFGWAGTAELIKIFVQKTLVGTCPPMIGLYFLGSFLFADLRIKKTGIGENYLFPAVTKFLRVPVAKLLTLGV